MENITIGHWLFALSSAIGYLLFVCWGYWKERKIHKVFNYRIIPVVIYTGLILILLVLIS